MIKAEVAAKRIGNLVRNQVLTWKSSFVALAPQEYTSLMKNDQQSSLRKELIEMLQGGNAHAPFDSVVEGVAKENRGAKPARSPHTLWQLLEHLRIAQLDILGFSRDPNHKSPAWPDGYWPKNDAPPNDSAWEKSAERFRADLAAFIGIVSNDANDVTAVIPHAPEGQTLLREALILADHNSYHLGQMALLRRMLGDWK